MTYTAGWNIPGCLPEVEPETFDTFNEAVAYLAETVDRFWDEDYLVEDDDRDDVDATWLDIHTALHNLPVAHDVGTQHEFSEQAGGLAFWITPTEPNE